MLVLLGTSLQGVLRGLQDPSRGGVCICHLCLGPVSWRLTQISPLGQCRAPPQDFAAADNRLVWQSVQTLKAKQPWQLSTRTNILLRDTRPYTAQGWECARVCVYTHTRTAYPELWLNGLAFPDSIRASRRNVRSDLAHWQKSLPVGELSRRRNQRHLHD